MNQLSKNVLMLAMLMSALFAACTPVTEDEEEEGVTPARELSLSVETTSNSATISWPQDSEISWYFISYAKNGETLEHYKNHQDLQGDPISVTIDGLEPGTFYDVLVEGKDYLSGGKLIASKKIVINTQKASDNE